MTPLDMAYCKFEILPLQRARATLLIDELGQWNGTPVNAGDVEVFCIELSRPPRVGKRLTEKV